MEFLYLLLTILGFIAFGAAMFRPQGDTDRRAQLIAVGLFLLAAVEVLKIGYELWG